MSNEADWSFLREAVEAPKSHTEGSVAWTLDKVMRILNGRPNAKPMGDSQTYILKALQRSSLGAVMLADFTDEHVTEHAIARSAVVSGATTNQDVSYLGGALKYASSDPAFGKHRKAAASAYAAVIAAKPFLMQNGYISKSTPRTRVPVGDEIPRLKEYLGRPPKKCMKNVITAMPDIIEFALKSTRRISEICRLDREIDFNWTNLDKEGKPAPMYRVRNMKDPRKHNKEKWFPLYPDLAEIVQRQPVHPTDTRVFPYVAKSVGAKYARAKTALGIQGLRFHDNRRAGITDRLKKLTPNQVRHYFSGHENTAILERVYDATDPATGFDILRELEKPEPVARSVL